MRKRKQLVWPPRANGNVIEPTTLDIPVILIAECSQCGKLRRQNIMHGLCDKCALEYARTTRKSDSEQ